MARRAIMDEDGEITGRWFDPTKAKKWEEGTRWDGNNHVSLAPGCEKFDHETLYRTTGGSWIVYHWSQWQGSRDYYQQVSPEQAAEWLIACEHEIPKALREIENSFARRM